MSTRDWSPDNQFYAMLGQTVWMLITKYVKLHGLFRREPIDLIYLPVSIAFGWFHGFIKLFALLTLRQVSATCLPLRVFKADSLLRHLGVAAQMAIPTTASA